MYIEKWGVVSLTPRKDDTTQKVYGKYNTKQLDKRPFIFESHTSFLLKLRYIIQ